VKRTRLLAGGVLGSLVFCAQAQNAGPLAVEERSLSQARSGCSSSAAAPMSQDGLLLLMQQQQQFEEQIQDLQGQLEELRHELQVMKDAERERYLDLDTRINTLAEQGKTEQPDDSADSEAPNDPEADRDAYSAAKDKLIKRDFDAAAEAFEGYLHDFPNGQFRARAHFWLGKVYSTLKAPKPEKAQAQFQSVVDDYPGHSTAPTRLYTLAVLQARDEEVSPAKVNLHKLIKQYPDSSEASQAKTLLEQLNK